MFTESKLSDGMLRQDAASSETQADVIVQQVIRRERRRVRIWGVATATLWIITALYLAVEIWAYAVIIQPAVRDHFVGSQTDPAMGEQTMDAVVAGLKAMLVWPALFFLAGGCSLCFVLASRRATLRQVQASLAQISDRLKALAQDHADR